MNNFDRVAPIYDKLVGIVFGKAMHHAQTKFLKEIGAHSKVLILGGGTGWLLAELLSVRPHCQVLYIDASRKMIDLAQKKVGPKAQNVLFIHGTEKQIPASASFEVVITHFYLDLFDQQRCHEVCGLIRTHCHDGSLWVACDFVDRSWWHRIMLKAMYAFFAVISNLRTKRLPNWRRSIQDTGFSEIGMEYYSDNFICSALYKLGTVSSK